jgi:uncharacterized membrane protein YjfL (UPF0719 family)
MEWLFLKGPAYVALSFLIFAVGKVIYDKVAPYTLDEEMTQSDNPAVALAVGGFFSGMFIILLAVLKPGTADPQLQSSLTMPDWLWEGIVFTSWALIGIAALIVSLILNNRIVLRRMNVTDELTQDKNTGAGMVIFASNIASALFISGIVSGDMGMDMSGTVAAMDLPYYLADFLVGMGVGIGLFLAGQAVLYLFILISEKLTSYDIQYELEEKDNLAAGIAYGGNIVSLGILTLKLVMVVLNESPSLTTWYTLAALVIFLLVLNPVVRLFTDKILLPGSDLKKELCEDQNSGAGLVAALVQTGFAGIIFFGM